ncbi:MAG: fatty acid desaturase [Vallitaleaceae bacterium]|nr:fatty acid desaturase [Vallitaleaceae bacterium]
MSRHEWNNYLSQYAKPDHKKAVIQIADTLLPYILLLGLSTYLVHIQAAWWIVAPLMILSAGFMVRLFILFHDCTHDSFTKSKKWNQILGTIFGIFAFTSFASWKKEHGIHHGTVGNLEKRGTGDVWTLTVSEYQAAHWSKKAIYRIFRNPIFLFGVAPFFLFAIINRMPKFKGDRKTWISFFLNNSGIVLVGLIFSIIFSFQAYLVTQLIVIAIASSMGVWLFYVQHQFEEVYWENDEKWNSIDAALKGSTFYKLPFIFEWISGSIGYHHIHHLNLRIPNYHLKACYLNNNELKKVKTVTLISSLPLAFLQFYDEKKKALVSYRQINTPS